MSPVSPPSRKKVNFASFTHSSDSATVTARQSEEFVAIPKTLEQLTSFVTIFEVEKFVSMRD
jgi:hypothetical protein